MRCFPFALWALSNIAEITRRPGLKVKRPIDRLASPLRSTLDSMAPFPCAPDSDRYDDLHGCYRKRGYLGSDGILHIVGACARPTEGLFGDTTFSEWLSETPYDIYGYSRQLVAKRSFDIPARRSVQRAVGTGGFAFRLSHRRACASSTLVAVNGRIVSPLALPRTTGDLGDHNLPPPQRGSNHSERFHTVTSITDGPCGISAHHPHRMVHIPSTLKRVSPQTAFGDRLSWSA